MKIFSIYPHSFAANTYILTSDGKALVVDPAVSIRVIRERLNELNAELCGILLTHGHFDHTATVDTLRDEYSVPLIMHKGDAPMLTNGRIDGFYDFYGRESIRREAERLIADGETICLGNEEITTVSTPGHSPGSVCYVCPKDGGGYFLLTGDTLFSDNVGRCDLWHGDGDQLINSLKILGRYDRSVDIFPGHGPSAKLGAALAEATYYFDI